MVLMYLDQRAIDDIKLNFEKYKDHFEDDTNRWFIKRFSENGWIKESKVQCNEFRFVTEGDYTITDAENVRIIYEALKDLSPAIATDERLWAGMLFCQFWDYVRYRRCKELESGDKQDVLNSFLFMRGTKRSCFINCLARLWWTGFLLYDADSDKHYEAVNFVCENAYASLIVLLSSNGFAANKKLILGVIDAIREREDRGEKIGRYHFVESDKYLNCLGGTQLLDTMSREDVKGKVAGRLERIYGQI
ncbi:DUF6339 family protein [Butyrivibrio sp. AE3004]|uniref:DUF6339 family protein n=1 Tax=Butyrivibrio sp. AE3004 TaxID=1506994 RepID=UPI0004942622|nr:DUF6339 family protein [Butyrivibrio sp. AE3004]